MYTNRSFFLIVGASLLTGCAEFGDAWRDHAAAEARMGNPSSQQTYPARNYVSDPIPVPMPAPTQPSFVTTTAEGYQTIMVNTPQGIVYKQCRMLNGKAVACF